MLHSNRVQQTTSQGRTVKLNPAENNVHQYHDVTRMQKNTADINDAKAGAFGAATTGITAYDWTQEAYKQLSEILWSSSNVKFNYQYNVEKCRVICSLLTTR